MIFAINGSQAAKKSKIIATVKPRRTQLLASPRKTHDLNISFGTIF